MTRAAKVIDPHQMCCSASGETLISSGGPVLISVHSLAESLIFSLGSIQETPKYMARVIV